MKFGAPGSFGAQLKTLREAAGFTQEELATVAGLSVHAVSALERGERRRPHVETVRVLAAAFDLTGAAREAYLVSARAPAQHTAVDELVGATLPVALTTLVGRDGDLQTLQRWLSDPSARLVTLTGPGRPAWLWRSHGRSRRRARAVSCSCRSPPFGIPCSSRRQSARRSASRT